MSTETSKELMRVYLEEVLGNRNFDLIPDIAAADLVDSTQPGKTGPDALDAHARGFCQNTPDVEIEVIDAHGDHKITREHKLTLEVNLVTENGEDLAVLR